MAIMTKIESNRKLVEAVANRFNLKRVSSVNIGGGFDEVAKVNIEILLTQEDLQAIINDMAKGE